MRFKRGLQGPLRTRVLEGHGRDGGGGGEELWRQGNLTQPQATPGGSLFLPHLFLFLDPELKHAYTVCGAHAGKGAGFSSKI